MSRVENPYIPFGIRAQVRKHIVYQYFRGQYRVRVRVDPSGPPSAEQEKLNRGYREAMRAWSGFSDEQKASWYNFYYLGYR